MSDKNIYNPYDWEIINDFELPDLEKSGFETDEEYISKLYQEYGRWLAYKSVLTLSIELAFINLKDSLNIAMKNDGYEEAVEHDCAILMRNMKEYKYICCVIETIVRTINQNI